MRAGLAVIAALALCVTPAVAQGKTKSKGGADVGALAVEIVEVCEEFSRGDVLAPRISMLQRSRGSKTAESA